MAGQQQEDWGFLGFSENQRKGYWERKKNPNWENDHVNGTREEGGYHGVVEKKARRKSGYDLKRTLQGEKKNSAKRRSVGCDERPGQRGGKAVSRGGKKKGVWGVGGICL